MKGFVFWTGVYNIAAGLLLFFPGVLRSMDVRIPATVVWTELAGFLVVFLGLMLMWASRDMDTRATIIYWYGWLRLVAFVHMGWFGFFDDAGALLGVFGAVELVLGLSYILGMPKATGRTHEMLFLDSA